MRDTPEGIKEELRAAAQFAESEAAEGGFDPMTVASEAVELLEHYEGALKRIAGGEAQAERIASEALDPLRYVRGGGLTPEPPNGGVPCGRLSPRG